MDLIQLGEFKKYKGDFQCLTGRKGIIDLEFMGSSEFEYGAIPRAYRRLLYNYEKYGYRGTDIYTPEKKELILFSNLENSERYIKEIVDFIKDPYPLHEASELEKIPTSHFYDKGYKKRYHDFWWCIDPGRDWMAFFNNRQELFKKYIEKDYYEWWLKMPEERREAEYKLSLKK